MQLLFYLNKQPLNGIKTFDEELLDDLSDIDSNTEKSSWGNFRLPTSLVEQFRESIPNCLCGYNMLKRVTCNVLLVISFQVLPIVKIVFQSDSDSSRHQDCRGDCLVAQSLRRRVEELEEENRVLRYELEQLRLTVDQVS